ncbi:hypothetical protein IEQ34_018832 [Dendrobium chrysotoxum]|uniref:Uncharacterized protein n=1 Tax=Dendrobium chrysotoxum TaxID=161865 RepID=A0AAV7G844_DENCH|nr:hypothetical protein IEQ34_018832 [Dendrobium chrysotoxum]
METPTAILTVISDGINGHRFFCDGISAGKSGGRFSPVIPAEYSPEYDDRKGVRLSNIFASCPSEIFSAKRIRRKYFFDACFTVRSITGGFYPPTSARCRTSADRWTFIRLLPNAGLLPVIRFLPDTGLQPGVGFLPNTGHPPIVGLLSVARLPSIIELLSDAGLPPIANFRPPLSTDYGPSNLCRRLQSFRPPSPYNSLSDLCHPLTIVLSTTVTRPRSLQPVKTNLFSQRTRPGPFQEPSNLFKLVPSKKGPPYRLLLPPQRPIHPNPQTLIRAMDHASSSSPSTVRSPRSKYTPYAQNTSQQPNFTGSSPRHSPITPRSSPKSNSSASSSSGGGSVIVYDSESSEEWGSSDSAEHEAFELFLRKNRCMRYYLEWNACVDQAIRNGQDHRIQCCRLSKVLRNCVRLS